MTALPSLPLSDLNFAKLTAALPKVKSEEVKMKAWQY